MPERRERLVWLAARGEPARDRERAGEIARLVGPARVGEPAAHQRPLEPRPDELPPPKPELEDELERVFFGVARSKLLR